jgi:hypothetical protein
MTRPSTASRNVVLGVERNHLILLSFQATRPAALRGLAWMAATSAAMTLWLSGRQQTNSQRHRASIFIDKNRKACHTFS